MVCYFQVKEVRHIDGRTPPSKEVGWYATWSPRTRGGRAVEHLPPMRSQGYQSRLFGGGFLFLIP